MVCDFVSWVKKEDTKGNEHVLYLDDEAMKIKEKEMRVQFPDKSEKRGHGAIRWYFQLMDKDGVDGECADFSSPSKFPKPIVTAIKNGKLTYGITDAIAKVLFTPSAYKKYMEKKRVLYKDFIAKKDALDTEFKDKKASVGQQVSSKKMSFRMYKAKDPAKEYTFKIAELAKAYLASTKVLFSKMVSVKLNRTKVWK